MRRKGRKASPLSVPKFESVNCSLCLITPTRLLHDLLVQPNVVHTIATPERYAISNVSQFDGRHFVSRGGSRKELPWYQRYHDQITMQTKIIPSQIQGKSKQEALSSEVCKRQENSCDDFLRRLEKAEQDVKKQAEESKEAKRTIELQDEVLKKIEKVLQQELKEGIRIRKKAELQRKKMFLVGCFVGVAVGVAIK